VHFSGFIELFLGCFAFLEGFGWALASFAGDSSVTLDRFQWVLAPLAGYLCILRRVSVHFRGIWRDRVGFFRISVRGVGFSGYK